jgi:hypothetical protein
VKNYSVKTISKWLCKLECFISKTKMQLLFHRDFMEYHSKIDFRIILCGFEEDKLCGITCKQSWRGFLFIKVWLMADWYIPLNKWRNSCWYYWISFVFCKGTEFFNFKAIPSFYTKRWSRVDFSSQKELSGQKKKWIWP